MDESGYCETENRDFDGERRAVHIDHRIMSSHGAQRRFNDRAAGILIFAAGRNMRLLADHAFTLDFGLTTVAVGDKPVAAKKLNRVRPRLRMVTV